MHHGYSHHSTVIGHAFKKDFVFNNGAGLKSLHDQWQIARLRCHTHTVIDIKSLSGGRAYLGNHNPCAILARHMHHQVRKTQVGKHAPLASEINQVRNLLFR